MPTENPVLQEEIGEKSPIGLEEYIPPRISLLREYRIELKFLFRGMVISVGCKDIAFNTIEEGIKELNEYINNPHHSTEKWRKLLD